MEWWTTETPSGSTARIISASKRAKASASGFIATAFTSATGFAPRWYLQGLFA